MYMYMYLTVKMYIMCSHIAVLCSCACMSSILMSHNSNYIIANTSNNQ